MRGFLILTSAPTLGCARRIAKVLLQKKLAACVTVTAPGESVYWWKSRIVTARERILFIKTTPKRFSAVEKTIRSIHPYEIPEILALAIHKGSRDYLGWMQSLCG